MSTGKMLIDATHPEETRVVVLRNGKVEEFDYESAARKLLRGNIYLAKVTRVEPSLQAAFVEYGGNRHGFLAFSEIHPDYYQIPLADRQALLDAEAEEEAEEERQADARAEARAGRRSPQSGGQSGGQPGGDGQEQPRRGRNDGRNRRGPSASDPGAEQPDVSGSSSTAHHDDHQHDHGGNHPAGSAVDHAAGAAPAASQHYDDHASASVAADAPPRSEALDRSRDPSLSEAPAAEPGTGPVSVPEDPSLDEVTTIEDGGLVETRGSDRQPDLDSEPGPETVGAGEAEEDAYEEAPDRRQRRRARVYKIQEVIKKRQIILVQVVKEERGTKGAALTTYLSLAGRYTVLMPNTGRGGGISRKITNAVDRKRLKAIAHELEVPDGMGLIIRTAGAARTKQEVKRDFEYLLRLWESVRELTLQSVAPSLVYEEGDLIKRSIRDLYTKDVEEIVVSGDHAFKDARDFMRMLMPSHTKNVLRHEDPAPIFTKYPIERQLNAMFSPYVHLKSGGYLVINQTEALVAIDINSGKSTREFSIEETALNTNLEAADEIARQLKLRDLAGLIVVDFIDMEEKRNNRAVERRMKDALRHDRARIQVGRISHFGLLEMSRQRMRTGVLEGSTTQCPHCQGTGIIRSIESVSLAVLRGLEDAIMAGAKTPLTATTTSAVALYLLNNKRAFINEMEARIAMPITIAASDKLQGANFTVERGEITPDLRKPASRTAVNMDWGFEGETVDVVAEADERPGADSHESNLIEIDTEADDHVRDDETGDEAGSERGRGQSADGERRPGGGREENGRRRRRGRRSRGSDRPGSERGPRDGQRDGGRDGQPRPNGQHVSDDGVVPADATEAGDDDEIDDVETIGEGEAGAGELDSATGDGAEVGADGRPGNGRRGRRRGRRGGRRGRLQDRPIGAEGDVANGAPVGMIHDDAGQPMQSDDAQSVAAPHANEHYAGPATGPVAAEGDAYGSAQFDAAFYGSPQGTPDPVSVRTTPDDAPQPPMPFEPGSAPVIEPVVEAADEMPVAKAPRSRSPRGAIAAKREAQALADAEAAAAVATDGAMVEATVPAPVPHTEVAATTPAAVTPPAPAAVEVDESRLARIAPVASEPVVASVVIGSGAAAQPTDTPKPVRRGWWSRPAT